MGSLTKMHKAAKNSAKQRLSIMADNTLPLILTLTMRQRHQLFRCDIMSTCMLPEEDYDRFVAAETLADGNCLYNAVSMHLVGNCSLASELRCTIYELVENNSFNMRMLNSCIYYVNQHGYITGVSSDRTHCGALTIATCANVIGNDIQRVYPGVNPNIRPYYHRTFKPEFLNSQPMRQILTWAG